MLCVASAPTPGSAADSADSALSAAVPRRVLCDKGFPVVDMSLTLVLATRIGRQSEFLINCELVLAAAGPQDPMSVLTGALSDP